MKSLKNQGCQKGKTEGISHKWKSAALHLILQDIVHCASCKLYVNCLESCQNGESHSSDMGSKEIILYTFQNGETLIENEETY